MVDEQPDVTILVPALNEERTIREVVERLIALPISKQIIVINDGSTDSTLNVLKEFGEQIIILSNKTRGGKGRAIRTGLVHAKGRTVVVQDADLEYAPEQIPSVVQPLLKGPYRVSFGARFTKGMHPKMALPNKLVNILLRWAVKVLYGVTLNDEATCYKAFERRLILDMELSCERFEFCPEVTAKAIRLGEPIHEVPISYEPRNMKEGKKIRWTDAPEAFWTLLKFRFWKPTKR